MKLFIDTSETRVVRVALEIQGKRHEKVESSEATRSQAVLPLVEALLAENEATLSDITHIYVHKGPGSFTGIRVGVAIANTLAHTLKVPVNDLPLGTSVVPVYAPSKFDE